MGHCPILKAGMKPFIYDSECHTHVFGTKMSGHFTFTYTAGIKKGQNFMAKIDTFYLRLPEG